MQMRQLEPGIEEADEYQNSEKELHLSPHNFEKSTLSEAEGTCRFIKRQSCR